MGEVYKAKDTRLDRTVALKVLPSHLISDPDLRRRFEREARAISALSHPNICTLFDIGSHEGQEFLVMEYLDGTTLAERLMRGALPLTEVIRIGVEIADALEKAHRLGIVHRDLKPGNIVLTKTGSKLLDFGLAKWMPDDETSFLRRSGDHTTERQPLTAAGMLLGTVPYMAPEQLDGKDIDQRSDIFSLGAILYEMATGVRAFSATSNASLIAAIMRETPVPPSQLRAITPKALESIITVCMHKDPGERFQSAHDVKLALSMLTAGPIEEIEDARRPAWLLPVSVAALVVVTMLVAAAALWLRPRGDERRYRFSIAPPVGSAYPSLGEGGGFALSPDAQRLIFVAATPEGRSFLWLRALDADAPQLLESSEGGEYPFWSPDGRSIAFFADGKLKRMEVPDGPAQTICDAPSGRGGAWGANNEIVFSPSTKTGLFRVNASGGTPVAITKVDGQVYSHRWPALLPDGEHVLYVAQSLDPARQGLFAASMKSGETKRLLPVPASAVVAGDHLLYLRDRLLVRQPFDFDDLQLEGEPEVIADQIVFFVDRAFVPVSAAENGTIAFRRNATVNMRLAWYGRDGRRQAVIGQPGEYEGISLSPDETRIAFGRFEADDGLNHIAMCGANEGVPRRFSFNRGNQYSPIWSPDGTRVIFSDDYAGVDTLSEKPASGAGEERLLTKTPESSQYAQSWSPDGAHVLYRRDDPAKGLDVAVWFLGAGDKRAPYISGPFDEAQAQFSPDGKWVAYASTESGRPEVYVQPFPATGAKWQVSTEGGEQPRWRRDGKELFYLAADRRIMAVPIRVPGAFDASPAVPLFETTLGVGYLGVSQAYDVTKDGQRFIVASVDPMTPASPITVVTGK
jgi:Tol biopolymer transport system component